jgi:hypothetical protein
MDRLAVARHSFHLGHGLNVPIGWTRAHRSITGGITLIDGGGG